MQKLQLKLDSLVDLSQAELFAVEGGGFWGDLTFGVFATAHFIGYMLKDAVNNPIRPSEYR